MVFLFHQCRNLAGVLLLWYIASQSFVLSFINSHIKSSHHYHHYTMRGLTTLVVQYVEHIANEKLIALPANCYDYHHHFLNVFIISDSLKFKGQHFQHN